MPRATRRSTPEQLAAIDLGSNSFHMVVARLVQGELQVQEGLSEKVQLGAGLDEQNRITDDARARALDCLGRFAQRIRGVPPAGVRIVGTNALRMARNAREFIREAEAVLGHDIEIVAGREEARLIYLGVSHSLADQPGRRLVVDIGGGSTELIIGERFEALETESLHMGCVSFTRRFFPEGQCTDKAFDKAITAARQEVLSLEAAYRRTGWQQAVGASGSVKAIAQVCQDNGWSEGEITLEGLHRARRKLVKAGTVDGAGLKGLREDRMPIFPAGLAILTGIFEQLGITSMTLSSGALREGVLYDLLGRLDHEDVRERSIGALMSRYHVDAAQAQRVCDTAAGFLAQVATPWGLDADEHADALRWGAQLHEVGLSVSHSQFHKHGAYLIENSDLAGFSRQTQLVLATLVRGHRRKVPMAVLEALPQEDQASTLRLCLLLRLAARLHHARSDAPLPEMALHADEGQLTLAFPEGWLADHPLTQADLEQEQEYFAGAGVTLVVR
ncbi:exopolyphosphatase [Isoalcanivorax indicus]|uniref:exopolyphosphatase n=1 Tax=Isoalcanivorax indicus TaxID=2202653 RepID=UPI0024826817|nr:exopolyphosphatase [Isoalcanivorax indicus]